MADRIVLTSPAGKFIFYSTVIKSHAKLIRDAVTDQFMIQNPKERRIYTAAHANQFVKSYCNGSYNETPFTFIKEPS